MKVTGLKTSRQYRLKESDFLIDWDRQVSKPQARVKEFLHRYWSGHIVGEEVYIPGSRCRLDLVNFTRHIVVEVSPESSHSFSKFFHKDRFRFGRAVQRDLDKQAWSERNGFQYIELCTEDIGNLSEKLFRERGIDL